MEEEQKESGVSLYEIFSLIWKRIIWILAISVAAALVAWLVAALAVSPSKQSYRLSFVIEYPDQFSVDSNENVKMQYPDGTLFHFETAVYAENLEKAKQSDEAFKSIDTNQMSASGGISVFVPDPSTVGKYGISVSSKYFKNSEQATKFLKALCNEMKKTIVQKAQGINYSAGFSGYENVATSEQKIEILKAQHDSVLAYYENYLKLFAKFSYEGKTLKECYMNASVFFNRSELKDVQIVMKRYEKEVLTKTYNALEEEVKSLVKEGIISYEGLNSFTAKMAEHQEQIAKLDLEIELLGGDSQAAYVSPSEEELKTLYDAIVEETETCEQVITALYDGNTVFKYEQGTAVQAGGANALKYALVVFVAAFVVASVVFCVAEYSRKKKAGKAAEKAAETATETESEKE